ncbi:cytochrome P450 714C2-like [Populus alba x Populus x berolinensis]|uniref:Cytochrome P450 714C2-like n=1 Tax=Populus alba x Populus x berolinensis TaxID=444605 RepID=A0AAD6Q1X7_9ROSI|nr:cytochrome P450 714C2-like [Populus alba x Populus x berolinensis]
MEPVLLISLAVVITFLGLLELLYSGLVLKPERLRSVLRKQGIRGPSPSLLLGNISEIRKSQSTTAKASSTNEPPVFHNCAATLFPFFEQWRKQYGPVFVFSLGNTQILYVSRADVVREISTCSSLEFGKPSYQQKELGSLLGQGILTSNGKVWAHQRKIIAPELYGDKVKVTSFTPNILFTRKKSRFIRYLLQRYWSDRSNLGLQGMMSSIIESTTVLLNSWKSRIDKEGGVADIKIDEGMRSFSGDVISRACFGSNYSEGEEIFSRLRALQEAMSKKSLSTGIPGMRYIPTKNNREAWALEKDVRNLILEIVKERKETAHEKDLLQIVLESAKTSNLGQDAMDRFIVDNCKNIYLAGYETTAVSATWCLMLLAANQEWQDRVRAEVLEVCGSGCLPDADMLRKMKQLNMVIQEALRLYPPVAVVSREAFKEMKFGGITIPKGVNVWTMVLTLHTDPEVWGPDAYRFNPDRFAKGITGACKLPHLYMPFGVGPRMCLGQNLAIAELKILIALILSQFSLSLSPKYIHSPALRLVIEPERGVDLLIKTL